MALVNMNNIRNGLTRLVCREHWRPSINPYRGIRGPNPGPKRTYEERNRKILKAHENKNLVLADISQKPAQWSLPKAPIEPTVLSKERKLLPLHEELPSYANYTKKYDQLEEEEFFDPLFNPHLHEGRNKVDPNEEPFSSIYIDSNTDEAREFTDVRNIATPALWEYVERLSRITTPPEPVRRKDGEPMRPLPSGLVPPPENPPDLPYHICRTRNHLLPVYYHLDEDPDDCYTTVKQLTGDIWQFEQDLRSHLEGLLKDGSRILTSVQETDGRVLFKGRHLNEIVNWLYMKGF